MGGKYVDTYITELFKWKGDPNEKLIGKLLGKHYPC